MFHCNGWCFPGRLRQRAGINVCLRKVDPAQDLRTDPEARRHPHERRADRLQHPDQRPGRANSSVQRKPVTGLIAGAAPPVAVLAGAERIGIKLTHVYGLTEVYGPASVCAEQPGWDDLPVRATRAS